MANTRAAVRNFLGKDSLALRRFAVVGGYVRWEESVRNALKDARDRVYRGLFVSTGCRENHLLQGSSGAGKSQFINEIGAAANGRFRYLSCKLSETSAPAVISKVTS